MEYTGIENINEYYTQHYLSAIMEGELNQEVFPRWRELERASKEREDDVVYAAPDNALKNLREPFFRLREQMQQLSHDDLSRRCDLARKLARMFFEALEYHVDKEEEFVSIHGAPVPLMVNVSRHDGSPLVWGIAVPNVPESDMDVLSATMLVEQFTDMDRIAHQIEDDKLEQWCQLPMEEVVGQHIFNLDEPPRFVLLADASHVVLIDRTKWFEKRLLRFDMREILGRREPETLRAAAALLARDSLAPHSGNVLLDTLDDSSHRHAYGVSEDLKYALREAIELLGNEVIYFRKKTGRAVFSSKNEELVGTKLGDQLGRECLRYMYRLLFLFYIEARPELGYAPMDSDLYRQGYSLETLRELELVDLQTDEARNGTFFHDSIHKLFTLIFSGVEHAKQQDMMGSFSRFDAVYDFELSPLKSRLFDPEETPVLKGVKFRNFVLQRVIELMSLSRPKSRRDRRGRISYAQLGINQLGAVYESLLSYRGFFAKQDLYEVTQNVKHYSPLETAYFVPYDDLERYTKKEIVRDEDGNLVKHEKGKFIYRLAGRDRERSASYYTPEVLTRCLVKYALKALLEDDEGNIKKTPDEMLHLTVCEPAMGSAAFLNEAVNQLSEIYLRERQKEVIANGGKAIPHEEYAREKQKVKMYFADNNVFGVDLNPVAVELAEVSLWLNTIHQGAYVPWFGMQLLPGNSLVGCRREFFTRENTRPIKLEVLNKKGKRVTKTDKTPWLGAVPTRVLPGKQRPQGAIYHFLLGDEGMAQYNDYIIKGKGGKKPIKGLAEDEYNHITAWRKEFNSPLSDSERD